MLPKPLTAPRLPKADILAELARRKGIVTASGATPVFRLETYLFDKQLAFVLDPAPFKEATTTRRAGKSISCVADLTYTATTNAAVVCLYVTLSRKNAKRLVWPEFKRLNRAYGLGGAANESDLSLAFPNGSIIYLLGANDRASIEDFRGLPVKKAYLDESQSFPSYIKELIDDVLGPALMDHDGQLILIGTPGPIPSGYFFDLTKNPAWSHHRWSFFDNPKLPFLAKGLTHQDMLDRELKRRGVSQLDPSIQREWFGQWIVDKNSLVYHYDPALNDFEALPLGDWNFLLGVDLGFEDSDALAVLAYSDSSPNSYILEQVVTKHQDISSLCKQIDILRGRYSIHKIVIDTGGLGKKIAEEISKRYSIPMVAAEKIRKVEYIELMNDALRTGKLHIRSNSRFAQDSLKVEWDHDRSTPDKRVISSRFHSDICEAVLYVWRESYAYSYQKPTEEVAFGSPEWYNKQSDLMFEAEVERMQAAKELSEGDGSEQEYEPDHTNLQSIDRPQLRYHAKFIQKRGPQDK